MKVTLTDQIKILNKKILQNEAIIFALSSKHYDKAEYLTGED